MFLSSGFLKKKSQIVKHTHSSKNCLFLVFFSFTWCIADKSGSKFLFFFIYLKICNNLFTLTISNLKEVCELSTQSTTINVPR